MINNEDIKHIANLARLELTPAELEKYGAQLPKILDYVGQLQDVDTSEVDAINNVSDSPSEFRADEAIDWNEAERNNALAQASELDGGQIKVHRVLE
ncbi:MAG: Asp-tRNA(Asn)/Glu-tRNA(Gln) amidotransferase subunit GatC [Candidatus Falkowbacteria bacterium]